MQHKIPEHPEKECNPESRYVSQVLYSDNPLHGSGYRRNDSDKAGNSSAS